MIESCFDLTRYRILSACGYLKGAGYHRPLQLVLETVTIP